MSSGTHSLWAWWLCWEICNAHLGWEGDKGEQNLQGMLLREVLERCTLSAIS